MANRDFIDLETRLSSIVPGVGTPAVLEYVRRAAIEVCERTLVWRYEQDPLILSAGVYEYEYETPENTEVCGVIHARLNGASTLTPLIQEEIHRKYPSWPETDSTLWSEPQYIGQLNPDCFVVAPIPNSDKSWSLKMFLALRPTPDATGMEKTFFDEVETAILHGAAQHLLTIPDKPWSDEKAANYHAQQFAYKINARRARANLGNPRGSVSVQMQHWA